MIDSDAELKDLQELLLQYEDSLKQFKGKADEKRRVKLIEEEMREIRKEIKAYQLKKGKEASSTSTPSLPN